MWFQDTVFSWEEGACIFRWKKGGNREYYLPQYCFMTCFKKEKQQPIRCHCIRKGTLEEHTDSPSPGKSRKEGEKSNTAKGEVMEWREQASPLRLWELQYIILPPYLIEVLKKSLSGKCNKVGFLLKPCQEEPHYLEKEWLFPPLSFLSVTSTPVKQVIEFYVSFEIIRQIN